MERNSRGIIIEIVQVKLIFNTKPAVDVLINQVKVDTNLSLVKTNSTITLLPEWMDIQARDDDKLFTNGYIISFDIVADEHIVSDQCISIIPTWPKPKQYKWSPSKNLILNSIIFGNIKIDESVGNLTVCDITTYKHDDYIQKGNVISDRDGLLEIKFKTPLYDWLLDSML